MARVFLNGQIQQESAASADVNGEPYVDGGLIASLLGAEIKSYPDQGLAVVCTAESCLPLQVDDGSGGALERNGATLVGLGAVREFLRFDYAVEGDEVRLTTGGEVEKKIDEAKAGVLNVGDPMPDFSLPSIPTDREGAGDWVSLSSFRGKKLAIYAWGSW